MTDARPLIAHVLYRFDVGGLENGVVNLINRLPAERFRHAVIALDACVPSFAARVTQADVEFISLHKPPGHGIKLYPRLYRLFRRLRPAVVHTRNLAALECVLPAWAARVPVRVHGEHGWDTSDPGGASRTYQRLRRLYSPWVQRYVALSGELERYLVERVGIAAKRVTRICNGVDDTRFAPARHGRERLAGCPFGSGAGEVVIGTVGRLQAVKDQLTLVRALAWARRTAPEQAAPLRLLIAGEGALRSALEAEIAAHDLGEVVWLAGERRDVPEVMRALDVFALPSQAEGISNTILEAMASGLPVVATRVGGNAELVQEGVSGLLVAAQDPAALGEALLAQGSDAALRAAQGRAGRAQVVAEFSLEGMVARYAGMYERALATAGVASSGVR